MRPRSEVLGSRHRPQGFQPSASEYTLGMLTRSALKVALVIAVVAAGCGPGEPQAAAPAAAPARQARIRLRITPDSGRVGLSAARRTELQRLVDALWAAGDAYDDDAWAKAKTALVAEGEPGATRFIASLSAMKSAQRDAWWTRGLSGVFEEFHDAAVKPLCAQLKTDRQGRDDWVIPMLGVLGNAWGRGPECDDVVRALRVCLRAYDPMASDSARKDALRERAWEAAELIGRYAGPTGGLAAADVARLWTRSLRSADYAPLSAMVALESLGAAAGPAAPILLSALRDAGDDERQRIFGVLRSIGSAAPATLPRLRALLRGDDRQLRMGAIQVLGSWSDAASAADEDLMRIASNIGEDHDVRAAAAVTLAPRYATDERVWRPLLEAGGHAPVETTMIGVLARNEEIALVWIEAAPSLADWAEERLGFLIAESQSVLTARIVEAILRSPSPILRLELLWNENLTNAALSRLLEDPDARVRIDAAELCLGRESMRERAVTVATSLLQHPDAELRSAARRILHVHPLSERDREQDVAALATGNDTARVAAVRALSSDDLPIESAETLPLAWLADRILNNARYSHVLVRCRGGRDAYWRRMREILARGPGAGKDYDDLLDAVRGGGLHALQLRSSLSELTFGDDVLAERDFRETVAEILGEFETDATAYALAVAPHPSRRSVERLLALESRTCDALVLFAGRGTGQFLMTFEFDVLGPTSVPVETWDDGILGVLPEDPIPGLLDAVRRAAQATGAHAELRRRGAALLALRLPRQPAIEVLAALAHDEHEAVSVAALHSLRRMEQLAPGSVPVEIVIRGLTSPPRHALALDLAREIGARGAPIVPALREIFTSKWAPNRVAAAALVLRITGDAEEPAAVVRSVLAAHERTRPSPARDDFFDGDLSETEQIPWADVAVVLTAAEPEAGDVALITGVIPTGDPTALLPLLARHGASAASAIPTLRRLLVVTSHLAGDRWAGNVNYGERYPTADAAARALAAIGPPARVALPDLRAWIAATGDVTGVARAAVRRIK